MRVCTRGARARTRARRNADSLAVRQSHDRRNRGSVALGNGGPLGLRADLSHGGKQPHPHTGARRGEEDCVFLHERARPEFAQVSLPKWAVPIVGITGVLSLLCAMLALSREEASVRARLRFQEKVPPH